MRRRLVVDVRGGRGGNPYRAVRAEHDEPDLVRGILSFFQYQVRLT